MIFVLGVLCTFTPIFFAIRWVGWKTFIGMDTFQIVEMFWSRMNLNQVMALAAMVQGGLFLMAAGLVKMLSEMK